MSKSTRPFGLSFLTEVPADQLASINGGRHHKKHKHPTSGSGSTGTGSTGTGSTGTGSTGGGTFTTMHVSMPQPAFPTGDSG